MEKWNNIEEEAPKSGEKVIVEFHNGEVTEGLGNGHWITTKVASITSSALMSGIKRWRYPDNPL